MVEFYEKIPIDKLTINAIMGLLNRIPEEQRNSNIIVSVNKTYPDNFKLSVVSAEDSSLSLYMDLE